MSRPQARSAGSSGYSVETRYAGMQILGHFVDRFSKTKQLPSRERCFFDMANMMFSLDKITDVSLRPR